MSFKFPFNAFRKLKHMFTQNGQIAEKYQSHNIVHVVRFYKLESAVFFILEKKTFYVMRHL